MLLLLGGDLMLNQVPVSAKPLASLRPLARKSDLFLANLEIPLTNARTPTTRKTPAEIRRRDQYILKADPGHIANLKGIVDAVSLANNHTMDYGPAGLNQMLGLLDRAKIPYAGAGRNWREASRGAHLVARDGTRICLVSALAFMSRGSLRKCGPAGEKTPGIMVLAFDAKPDTAYLRRWFTRERRRGEKLVVALHWGIEKQTRPSSYQKALAQACLEAGADVVWGHHPHVLQPGELRGGRPILYSMGNLVSPRPARTAVASWDGKAIRWYPGTISGGRFRLNATAQRR